MFSQLSSTNKHLNDFIEDLNSRIQHQRSLHMNTLVNMYQEAVLTDQPDEVVNMLSNAILERDEYNGRKTKIDSEEWGTHDEKVLRALGRHSTVLSGGSIDGTRNPNKLNKALKYAGKRANAFIWNLTKKLQHDRATHKNELINLNNEIIKHSDTTPDYQQMVHEMLSEQNKYDLRRTVLDAHEWSNLDNLVAKELSNDLDTSDEVLTAGATVADFRGDLNDDVAISGGDQQIIDEAWNVILQ